MAEIPKLTLRDRLRISREHAGYTSVESLVADIRSSGDDSIAVVTARRLEANLRPPKDYQLRLWARATGVPFVWLKTGEVPPDLVNDGSAWNHDLAGQLPFLRAVSG
jgi:hypothetical protein